MKMKYRGSKKNIVAILLPVPTGTSYLIREPGFSLSKD